MRTPTFFVAFAAGLLSFFAPCTLPLIPSYLLYITGITSKDLSGGADRGRLMASVVVNSMIFVAGFSLVFVCLGALSTIIGQILFAFKDLIRIAGGILIIILGFYMTGLFKIGALDLERRFAFKRSPSGYLGSFLFGITFAAAWTPCAGPILGSILLLAGGEKTLSSGIFLLVFYSLGLGVPFIAASIFINSAVVYIKMLQRYTRAISIASGIFVAAVGLLLLSGRFGY